MSKLVKIGAVLKGERNNFGVTGNGKAKNEKYNYNVEIIVTDATGKEVGRSKNGLITMIDPRSKEQQDNSRKIPDNLRAEMFISVDE
jgi:hypothetical protein